MTGTPYLGSTFNVASGMARNLNVYSGGSSYTVLGTDSTVLMNSVQSVFLPQASSVLPGQSFKIINGNTSQIAIGAHAGDAIDGASNYYLPSKYSYVEVMSDGTNWWVIDSTIPSSSYVGADGNTYWVGTAYASATSTPASMQSITATSGAPATISGMSLSAGIGTYFLDVSLQYQSAAAAGTPSFGFLQPSGTVATYPKWISGFVGSSSATVGQQASAIGYVNGPAMTVSGTNYSIHLRGSISFTVAGTIVVGAYSSSSSDPFKIQNGVFSLSRIL